MVSREDNGVLLIHTIMGTELQLDRRNKFRYFIAQVHDYN
jgi:hypothetical protein